MIMKNKDLGSRLIYSTALGSICPGCGQAMNICVCQDIKKAVVPDFDGAVVRIAYDKKGRKGKGMTLISGLGLSEAGLFDLAKQLKQRFGTGGSVKKYVIELQGDFRAQMTQELRKLGFLK